MKIKYITSMMNENVERFSYSPLTTVQSVAEIDSLGVD
jgi:hypothetical protein